MFEALKELFADELQEAFERGKEKQMISKICIKLKKKKTVNEIAEELEEPVEKSGSSVSGGVILCSGL